MVEKSKDFINLKNILFAKKKVLITIITLTTLLFLGSTFVIPPQYESTVLIKVKGQKVGGGLQTQAGTALALLGGLGMGDPSKSYIELIGSRSVLEPVIEIVDIPDKDKIDNVKFAQKYLTIQNIKGTDLIEVRASGASPQQAQEIGLLVTDSFRNLLTAMNQEEQSSMAKFLSGRLEIAKVEMEKAERDLDNFRQKSKVFVPEEQAKALILKLQEVDKQVIETRIGNESNQAKLNEIFQQLQKQNTALLQYNLADNPSIQSFRNAIINKQVELVNLEQEYTDKHIKVTQAKKEIEELKTKLKDEVSDAVKAETNTLNPVHVALVQKRVETETALVIGQSMLNALRLAQSEAEKDLSKLSSESVTYIALDRQVHIAQEVYAVLVKGYEQTRVQAAMESMDIAVVDKANIPKRPYFPNKLIFLVLGLGLGIIISAAYLFFIYDRQDTQYYSKSL